jgi:hypothetical protein
MVRPLRLASSSITCSGVLLAGRPRHTMSTYVAAFSAVVPASPAMAPFTAFSSMDILLRHGAETKQAADAAVGMALLLA